MENDGSSISKGLTQSQWWKTIFDGKVDSSEVVEKYLTDQIQLRYLATHTADYSDKEIYNASIIVTEALLNTTTSTIKALLKKSPSLLDINSSNIPQYSNLASAFICVPQVLVHSTKALTYTELGYSIFAESKSDIAAKKFGENHGKLACLLDLAQPAFVQNHKAFCPSVLSIRFCQMKQTQKTDLLVRLCYRIPFIQHAVITTNPKEAADSFIKSVLAPSTYERRKANSQELLAFALED